jgi:hypothetical protein
MTLLIIGIIVFAVGSYFDIDSSELVRKAGGSEWNPFLRDHDKKFLATRSLMVHVGFAAFVLISHFTWLPDDQKPYTGIGLLILGIASFVVAFAVNRPLYKKLMKAQA